MGSNDAKEMLEVAKEECGRLERENAELTKEVRGQYQWGEIMKAERDAALAVIEQVTTSAREGLADCDDDYEMSSLWVLETLIQPPASALAKVKADAWDEGFNEATTATDEDYWCSRWDAIDNPYREKEAQRD